MEPHFKNKHYWAVILGGSSGIGWGIARKMAEEGMHLLIIHRDRKKTDAAFKSKLAELQGIGVTILTQNIDALRAEERQKVMDMLKTVLGSKGKIRLFVHAISRGNLKPMVKASEKITPIEELPPVYQQLQQQLNERRQTGGQLSGTDFSLTLQSMALSLYDWVKDLHQHQLFADDARVIGLTSEGSHRAWPSYGAVSAAKAALEAIGRAIALEFAPHGIRCNILQPGVTDTPSLRMIPGADHLKANALIRNPFRRLTSPEDVANVVYLLSRDEAAWVNGAIIPVDGGEKNS